jgi:TnpA family transposase
MAHGCNIGITKMAQSSKNISLNNLENTVNWYFSLPNLRKANDAIVSLMGKFKINKLFNTHSTGQHTSSDGQKFYTAMDSIHANYSYKYFGKEKGVVLYSFIDDIHRLFYSAVINASEREAAYVVDGIMHNEVVQSEIHSTDTHGYLLGIQFAPRIKGFQDQNLYSMEGMNITPPKEYILKMGEPINTEIIAQNWDSILKMVTAIKLKHTTASTLLKRLNSYSRQHPVYQALKELGKVIRTRFVLQYMDDEFLRRRIDTQLNKIENAHQFARAVFYGNSGEIQYASKEQQLISDACKRLIQNAIVCWNYLYLSDLIDQTRQEDRVLLMEAIAASSPVSWGHVNMQGEFNFSEELFLQLKSFNLDLLLKMEIEVQGKIFKEVKY